MNNTVFKLSYRGWLVALISATYSAASMAAAGKVEFSLGDVAALSADGRSRVLTKGSEINPGDTIQTVNGRAQVRFTDGGYISLQPNTEFKVEDYAYSGKTDGSEKGFFSLVKGGLRAITGAIGHGTNKSAYRVSTPVATIGIRGTEYTATQQEGGGLNFHVGDGAVFVETPGGNKVFYQGQNGSVDGQGGAPQHTSDTPGVGAAGPENPNQQQQEQQQNQQNQQTFIAGDIRDTTGSVCGSESSAGGGGCGFVTLDPNFNMAAEIAAMGTQYASYSGYTETSNWSASAYLSVSFGANAYVSGNLYVSGYDTSASTSLYGGLNKQTGAFQFEFSPCSTSCGSGEITHVSGGLEPVPGLTKAKINFGAELYGNSVSGSVGLTKSNDSMGGG